MYILWWVSWSAPIGWLGWIECYLAGEGGVYLLKNPWFFLFPPFIADHNLNLALKLTAVHSSPLLPTFLSLSLFYFPSDKIYKSLSKREAVLITSLNEPSQTYGKYRHCPWTIRDCWPLHLNLLPFHSTAVLCSTLLSVFPSKLLFTFFPHKIQKSLGNHQALSITNLTKPFKHMKFRLPRIFCTLLIILQGRKIYKPYHFIVTYCLQCFFNQFGYFIWLINWCFWFPLVAYSTLKNADGAHIFALTFLLANWLAYALILHCFWV